MKKSNLSNKVHYITCMKLLIDKVSITQVFNKKNKKINFKDQILFSCLTLIKLELFGN